jgi:hypothetical protein
MLISTDIFLFSRAFRHGFLTTGWKILADRNFVYQITTTPPQYAHFKSTVKTRDEHVQY